jgi:hypothetical protein
MATASETGFGLRRIMRLMMSATYRFTFYPERKTRRFSGESKEKGKREPEK